MIKLRAAVQLIVFGLLGMLAVQYTYLASIKHGNAAVATLLQYLAPVMIIIYLILRKQTVLTRQDLLTVSLALVGCIFLLTDGSISQLSVPTIFQWAGTACIIGMIVLVALTSKDSLPLQKEKPLRVS
ncbi:MAG TPA: DMT family transporter [Chondromyces sp.]|nr:DMT family transporter [Chondromyces sp.]